MSSALAPLASFLLLVDAEAKTHSRWPVFKARAFSADGLPVLFAGPLAGSGAASGSWCAVWNEARSGSAEIYYLKETN